MGEPPLRDLKKNTELLILVEFLDLPTARMKQVADSLGITVQAVSQYISEMKRTGLVKDSGGRVLPTRKGMQLVQEHFGKLKEQVDGVLKRIAVIDRCVAIAGEKVAEGQAVGLVMEDGMLMAYPGRKSPSSGRALENAEEGDDLLVGQLEGIVDLELGKLLLIEAPGEYEGGSKRADVKRVSELIDRISPGLIVAGDTVGAALLSKATEELFTIHAPVESAMSALSKGVDVAFCGTKESVDGMLEAVSQLKKQSGYAVSWKTLKA